MIKGKSKVECFGEVDKYFLLGGGALLIYTLRRLKEFGIMTIVVTSARHAQEVISVDMEKDTLLGWLDREGVYYKITEDVSTDCEVLNSISDKSLGLSFGAAWIFKKDFINRFNGKLLNIHGSQLPKDRGGGDFSWRIMVGDKIGVSLIHKIDHGVDTGDIVFHKKYTFPEGFRVSKEYQKYSISKDRKLLDIFFDKVNKLESFELSTQEERLSSYWPRLSTERHGFLDWRWSLLDIERFVCAFDDPYMGASTFINGCKVRLKECYSLVHNNAFHPFQKGIVYRKYDSSFFVATEDGSIVFKKVLDDHDNDMSEKIQVGDRFYTPQNFIEESMQYRAIYSPTGLKDS